MPRFALLLLIVVLMAPRAMAASWQNPVDALDVNADTKLTTSDLLNVVNRLLAHGAGPVNSLGLPPAPPYVDVNGDDYLSAIDSLTWINYRQFGGGTAPTAADTASVKLVTTDASGNPITVASVGDAFQLRMYVQDNRAVPLGVNAAHADILFNSSLAIAQSQIDPDQWWSAADLSVPGIIGHAGGVNFSISPLEEGGWYVIDILEMQATAPGIAQFSFSGGPSPIYDTLLWGVDARIPDSQVDFQGTTLTIVPEPASWLLGAFALVGLFAVKRRR